MAEQVVRSGKFAVTHRDLEVWQRAFAAAMNIFRHSKEFPMEERYSLTDQIRRSSRSATTNIAEAWRKRRYVAAFASKLNDAEAEAAETQDWLYYAVECGYLERKAARTLFKEYDAIVGMLVNMIGHSEQWTFPSAPSNGRAKRGNG